MFRIGVNRHKTKGKLPVRRKFQLTKRKKNRKTALMPGIMYIPKLNNERLCVVMQEQFAKLEIGY